MRMGHPVTGTIRFIGDDGERITPEAWADEMLHHYPDDHDQPGEEEETPGLLDMARRVEAAAKPTGEVLPTSLALKVGIPAEARFSDSGSTVRYPIEDDLTRTSTGRRDL